MNPLLRDAAYHAPAHVLFPEAYQETKRMIIRDFAFLGGFIVWSVVVIGLAATAAANG